MGPKKQAGQAAQLRKLRAELARERALRRAAEQSEKEAREQQAATAEILKVIAKSPDDVQPVFDAIVAAGKRLLPEFRVALMLVRDGKLHYVAHAGVTARRRALFAKRFPVLPIDTQTVVGTAVVRKRVVVVADILAKGLPYKGSRVTSQAIGWRAMLGVPLMREGKALGALGVSRATPGPYTDRQVRIAQTLDRKSVV